MLTGLLQPSHLILVLVIALVFLGPKRIPEAARSLGQGLKEFKSSVAGGDEAPGQLTTQAAPATDESSPARDAAPLATSSSSRPARI
jgi:sec-independent protein translocase protein TatA